MQARARRMLREALRFHNSMRHARHTWLGRAELLRDAREWCYTWLKEYRKLTETPCSAGR